MTRFQQTCWVLAVAWMAVIFFLSSQAYLPTPDLFPDQDKMFHGVAFAVLGLFYLGAMKRTVHGYTITQVLIATLLVCIYGISDEIHQYYVPGRETDYMDVLADTIGGLLATSALWVVARKQAG